MKAAMTMWWRKLSAREQRLLLAVAAIAFLVLAWLLVVGPLADTLEEAKRRHGDAVVALAESRTLVDAIRRGGSEAPAAVPDVATLLSQSATEAGFPITRLERNGTQQATLAIEAVRPQAFFAWTYQMEATGLTVERLTATTNSDQTLAVQATFRGRSAQ